MRGLSLVWITDYIEDIEADFRVFYRIDDFDELDGPAFIRLAMRVGAYQGVIAARMAKEQDENNGTTRTTQRHDAPNRHTKPMSKAEMVTAAPGWFTFRTAKAVEN